MNKTCKAWPLQTSPTVSQQPPSSISRPLVSGPPSPSPDLRPLHMLFTLTPHGFKDLGYPPSLFPMTPRTSVLCMSPGPEHQFRILERIAGDTASGYKVTSKFGAQGSRTSQHSRGKSLTLVPRCLPDLPLPSCSLLPVLSWELGVENGQASPPPQPRLFLGLTVVPTAEG